ncbi:MAG TPA: hypothetical protein VK466_00660 [Terriglobales bacterium]|nr:hypothetical protein [Terriglobales bacterium]
MRWLAALLLSALLCFAALAQEDETDAQEPLKPPPAVPALQTPIKAPILNIVREGTVIPVRLRSPIKAKEAQVGDCADLALDHDLWIGTMLVARAGTPVEAVVVDAAKAKWASRGSRLAIEISELPLLNGQPLPLRANFKAHGTIGPVSQVAGAGTLEVAAECPLCSVLFAPVAVVGLFLPGTNKNIKANTIANAWVDRDLPLQVASLLPFQPKDPQASARLKIVRGQYGFPYDRNLYCNGIPLAHLRAHHRFQLQVAPGWYRFSMNPKKPPLEIFLGPDSETSLITDYDTVYIVNDFGSGKLVSPADRFGPDRELNTHRPFHGSKNEDEYLRSAKPIDEKEIFTRECPPLAVEGTAP